MNEEATKSKSIWTQIASRDLYRQELEKCDELVIAKTKNYEAFRQNIRRTRNNECEWFGANPTDLKSVIIPVQFIVAETVLLLLLFKKKRFIRFGSSNA